MLKNFINKLGGKEREQVSQAPNIQILRDEREKLEETLSKATRTPKTITINNEMFAVTADGYGERVKKIK
jgi:hypothetical protein